MLSHLTYTHNRILSTIQHTEYENVTSARLPLTLTFRTICCHLISGSNRCIIVSCCCALLGIVEHFMSYWPRKVSCSEISNKPHQISASVCVKFIVGAQWLCSIKDHIRNNSLYRFHSKGKQYMYREVQLCAFNCTKHWCCF